MALHSYTAKDAAAYILKFAATLRESGNFPAAEGIERAVNALLGPNGRVWPEWIACKAKMPDHDQLLLIRMKDGSTIGGVLRSSRGFVSKFTGWAVQDVTHWLPMPPHPEVSHPATGSEGSK